MLSSLALLLSFPQTGPPPPFPPQPSAFTATHRSGQTFLTWTERTDLSGERYRIYRHDAPISLANLDQATLLLEVPEGSARFFTNRHRTIGTGIWKNRYLDRYVIEDGGAELADGTGLLVWTVHTAEELAGGAHYAVTTVTEGAENRAYLGPENTAGPVTETVATPAPVRTECLLVYIVGTMAIIVAITGIAKNRS